MEGISKKLAEEPKPIGLKEGELVEMEYNPVTHKDVCEFIERLKEISKITRNHIVGPFKGYALTNVY